MIIGGCIPISSTVLTPTGRGKVLYMGGGGVYVMSLQIHKDISLAAGHNHFYWSSLLQDAHTSLKIDLRPL